MANDNKAQAILFANWLGYHHYDYLGGGKWESQYTGGEYPTELLFNQFEFDEHAKKLMNDAT